VLVARAKMLITLSRHEEAERAYADAVTAFDEALRFAPEYIDAHKNRGGALQSRGNLLAVLSRNEEAEQAYADAMDAFDAMLRWAPNDTSVYNNTAATLVEVLSNVVD
jgi:tetratricopeptide (TPR) repeat protein